MLAHEPGGPIPLQIGPYRILQPIGEGGMGAVFLAEQDHPHREVALKVIRADSFSAQLLRRFEHETEMLGRLQHPGIAQIYQAGTHPTAHGVQPYFAMEYVRGEPLDVYAREHQLGTHARLELAAKICDAIEHAHQKGVIHRDLKPGNILVTAEGQPKILDFGVARITDADVRTTTLHTDIGVLVGTLTYMSPEQASGDPDQLDTRSDVYSLGVVLFELLTGQLPYRIDRRMVPESVRAIREDEPSRLSTHDRTLRGDVETIVAKTLEKDKGRRYSSASALASDIRHYLADEPISARPPSAGYQLSKFARRNKVLVGGVAAFFLALVAGAIVATTQAVRARHAEKDAKDKTALVTTGLERATKAEKDALAQRDRANGAETLALERLQRAEIEQKKARESAAFLESLFGGINPDEAQGADTTLLRRILAGAAGRISTELAGQPEAELSIRRTLGSAYSALGSYDEAETELNKAHALALEHFGADGRVTLQTENTLADVYFLHGRHADSEELSRRTLERQERAFGPSDRDVLDTLLQLGETLSRIGNFIESEAILREALERSRSAVPVDEMILERGKVALAFALHYSGDDAEAERLFNEVIERRSVLYGEENSRTLEMLGNLALVVGDLGRRAEAEAIDRRVLAGFRHVYGPENPQTLNVLNNVASACERQGKYEEAEATWKECLEIRERTLGARHPDTLRTKSALGRLFDALGRVSEAEPMLEEALAGQRAVLGEEHNDTMTTKYGMASLLRRQKRDAEAAVLLAEIAERDRRGRGEADPEVGISLYNLAGTLQDAGDDAKAEPVLREVLALREKHGWRDEPYLAATMNVLAKVLERRGEHDEADELFETALDMRRREFGPIEVAYSLSDYGDVLLRRGDLERAEPLLAELCALETRTPRPGDWVLQSGKCLLGRCLAGQGRFREAEPSLVSGCEGVQRLAEANPAFAAQSTIWVAEMYEEWNAMEPDAARAELATTWRARATPAPER